MEQIKILPFINYVRNEDKSVYPFASTVTDDRFGRPFVDPDNDFRVGHSGGFLMNIDFMFVYTDRFRPAGITYETSLSDPNIRAIVDSIDPELEPNRNQYYYSGFVKGTKGYFDFWREETRRRKAGYIANCRVDKKDIPAFIAAKTQKEKEKYIKPVRITGDHYHYLNYGRLRRTPSPTEKAKLVAEGDDLTDFIEGFPRFWDGDYWNFKIDEFSIRNNYHLGKGKARGKGYSYKMSNTGANMVNLYASTTLVYLAYETKYLTEGDDTIAVMTKNALDFMESNTYWRRGIAKETMDNIVLGYQPQGSHRIEGWKSRVLSFPIKNNESAGIGKRARRIVYEESGRCPNLQDSLNVTLSSTEVGLRNIGNIIYFGTAGTKDANWEPFANAFFNPGVNKSMPFENIWDDHSRTKTCGFFHPQVWNLEPHIDEWGNSLLEEAYVADIKDKDRARRDMDLSDYIVYVGQRANKPEEAFRGGNENLFSSPELDLHDIRLRADADLQYYRDGMVVEIEGILDFKTNLQLENMGLKRHVHPYLDKVPFNPRGDLHGCTRMYYPPFKINGKIPDNIYVILADPVRKDLDNKELTLKHSLNAFIVMALPNDITNTRGDVVMAVYVGRPNKMTDANRILLNLAKYYNALVLPEVDVGTIVQNFREWGEIKRIMKDPNYLLDRKIYSASNAPYGTAIGSGKTAEEALINLADLIYSKVGVDENGEPKLVLHNIRDRGIISELRQFNSKGNFDRISALRLYPYARMYHTMKKRDKLREANQTSIYQQIGLYSTD